MAMRSISPPSSDIQVIYADIKDEPGISSGLIERDTEFNFLHGNIRLRVNNTEFVIHSYKLENFKRIVQKLPPRQTFVPKVVKVDGDVEDIRRTLRVLYSSPYASNDDALDAQTLKSALRISTEYENTQLQEFCVRELDEKDLPLTEYLEMAREFSIPDWKEKAVDSMVARDDSITAEEIGLLGADLAAEVVARWGRRLAEGHVRASKRARVSTKKSKVILRVTETQAATE